MRIIFILFLLFVPNFIYSQYSELSSMQFLRISPSPGASALGNSYTSIAGNNDTLFYNPGSLAFFKLTASSQVALDDAIIRNMSFSIAYSRLFYNLNYMMFSSVFSLKNAGIIGVGFAALLYDTIAETLSTGVLTGKQLNSSDSLFIASYADMIGENLGLGGNIKLAAENAAGETISGLAVDAGIRYHVNKSKWSIGFVVQNAGLSIKKIDQNFQLPINFKLGGNYEFNLLRDHPDSHIIMLTSDIGKGLDADFSLGMGMEYRFQNTVFLRTGYQYQGAEPGFKIGAGLKYKKIAIDYAYSPLVDLGAIHKIEITYQFDHQNIEKKNSYDDITKQVTQRGIEINISDVVFEFSKADLKPEFSKILDKAVDMLQAYNDYDIKIEGHTDDIGADEDNLELSLLRAKTVYDYFIEKGINPKNLTYWGYGKKRPIADNSTEAGRQKNRRVNIIVTKKSYRGSLTPLRKGD